MFYSCGNLQVLGSVLIAALTCYEDEIIRVWCTAKIIILNDTRVQLTQRFLFQSRYRVMVEILNENDNMPHFLEDTIQPRYISEVCFTPDLTLY